MVIFDGDDARHDLRVWDSQRDRAGHDFLTAWMPPDFAAQTLDDRNDWRELAGVYRGAGDPDDGEREQVYSETDAAMASVVTRLPTGEQRSLAAALRAAEQSAATLESQMAAAQRTMAQAYAQLGTLQRDVDASQEVLRLWLRDFEAAEATLSQLRPQAAQIQAEITALRTRLTQLSRATNPTEAGIVQRYASKILGRIGGAERTVAIIGRAAKIAGTVAIVADVGTSLGSMFSDHAVVIRDETGNPIVAHYPCRQVVRGSNNAALDNAVSCPAPRLPGAVGAAHLFEQLTGLYIKSGNGNDRIALQLAPAHNPFAEIYVEGRGGNDEIYGGDFGERLIGGAGDDTIFGGAGDDVIYGDQLTALGVDPLHANDKLFGDSGQDYVAGQEGNDIVAGGADDDWSWWGAALSGGSGNDTVIGGSGRDEMQGDSGRDAIFARETDFGGADEADYLIDCGSGGPGQVVSASSADAGGTQLNAATGCDSAPRFIPTSAQVLNAVPTNGNWPWFP